MNLEPIGVIKSPVKEQVDEGWGKVVSEIHIHKQWTSGLAGLDEFSHVIVLFYMHESTFTAKSDLVRRPQGRADMPMLGIFAQRAKHRPNPIGITAVSLLGVHGNVLTVKGLDAIDGTPVLDVKPYFPIYDCVKQAKTPEWIDRLMEKYF
ncbi:MAG: tRNA (N6-threonylcarbamoyladenosine(37)-N6)-methyltransferase TrmO [Chloroflexota bacterium]